MHDEIETLLAVYPSARATTLFKGPHEVQRTFQKLKTQVERLPSVAGNPNLLVKYSYGKGNWATVPWLAILDSRETTSTQDGTYIVLLFSDEGAGCHLKLAQGVTAVKTSFGRRAAEELGRRAALVRESFPEMVDAGFDLSGDPKLGAEKGVAKLYEASTIFSKYWEAATVPSDTVIGESIDQLVTVYSRYIDQRLEGDESPDVQGGGERRIWAISPGEGGRLWEEFLKDGIIAFGWDQLGDLAKYPDQAAITDKLQEIFGDDNKRSNSSLACYQFSRVIQPGDIVIAKAGRKKVLGMGVVTSDYFYCESAEEYKNRRQVEWLRTDVGEFPGSGVAIKTLTELTPYPSIVELVKSYLDIDLAQGSGVDDATEEDDNKQAAYSIADIVDEGCFVAVDQLRERLDRLRLKKNIILQGPPGTGKTWLAKRLAYALIGRKERARIRVVQFHPNLSYEDFVRGWRPSGDGRLSLVDGTLMEAIEDAKNSSRPYVVVIEEINRGNPAQIFGEMLTLLEADKRTASEAIELSYRKHPDERVFVPPNLFVIGTMNVADRSLALVDMALRRRFAFIEMDPSFNKAWRDWLADEIGFDPSFVARIERRVTELNDTITGDPSLGPQFCIGHSYLTPPADAQISDPEAWFQQVASTEIGPLIAEYWFDNPSRVEEALSRFRT